MRIAGTTGAMTAGDAAVAGPLARDLVWPMVLVLASLATFGITWFAARSLDRQAQASDVGIASAVLAMQRASVARQAYDYAFWDTLIAKAVESQADAFWIDDNIGSYVQDAFGFDATFLIAADDRTLVGFVDGEPTEATAFAVLGEALRPLVDRARAGTMHEPGTADGLIRSGGRVRVVGAAAVTPENPTPDETVRRPRPVLVFSRPLDDAVLRPLRRNFGLQDLTLAEGAPAAGMTPLRLADPQGADLGWLAWRSERPGADLMERLAPALVAGLLAMLVLGGLFVRAVRRDRDERDALRRALATERELSDLKTRFVAMVSHEIRTPLATMRAATDLLMTYGDRMDEAGRTRELAAVQQQIAGLAELVDNVLRLGQDERRVTQPAQQVDLVALVERAHREACRASGIDGRLAVDAAALHAPAVTDPHLLGAILGNVIGNAVKFSGAGATVEVTLAGDAGRLDIAVADRGIGIPPDEFAGLGQPFRRGSNVGAVAGTGLGLAIVRQACDLLGGTVALSARDGGGTTVRIGLPNRAPPGQG